MRLVVHLPKEAALRELADGRSAAVLAGTEEQPVATLTLIHPHIDQKSLIEFASDAPRADLPAGASSDIVAARVERNDVGWEMQVIETKVTAGGQPAPVEVRLTAVFRFVPYQTFVAAAIARILDPSQLEALRPRIAAIFAGARPDWSGREPVSLAQLYD